MSGLAIPNQDQFGGTTSGGTPSGSSGSGNTPTPAPQGFGTLGYVNPAYADPTQNQVNPAQNTAYMQQYEQLVAQGLAPQFAQQEQYLQDSDAARGISNSGAASYLQGNLLGQQGAAYANAISPIVQQGYGYTQQDIMSNQGVAQQDLMANQGAANAASYYNAGTYNNYLDALQSAYLNSFGPNTGVTNAFGTAVGGIGQTVGGVYQGELALQQQELQAAAAAAGAGGG